MEESGRDVLRGRKEGVKDEKKQGNMEERGRLSRVGERGKDMLKEGKKTGNMEEKEN